MLEIRNLTACAMLVINYVQVESRHEAVFPPVPLPSGQPGWSRCPNHLRPPKIASGGTLTFNGLRPGGRICPSNLVRGDGIHYAITSYAIELRPPPYLFETQGLGLRLGARARAKVRG